MSLILLSFVAGMLTILAPCSVTLLPIVLGGSSSGNSRLRPIFVTLGLALSTFIFTLLLRTTTVLIDIDPKFWQYLAGGILVIFGAFMIFPQIWDTLSYKLRLSNKSDKLLHKVDNLETWYSPFLIGAALGPVFSSCSPTYSVLIATVLPENFAVGIINIMAYIIGLSVLLLPIGYLGQGLVKKLKWAINPNGKFKKVLGILFLFVGVAIIFSLDKTFEEWVLQNGYLNDLLNFEFDRLEDIDY